MRLSLFNLEVDFEAAVLADYARKSSLGRGSARKERRKSGDVDLSPASV
jgi:hypothetical protein